MLSIHKTMQILKEYKPNQQTAPSLTPSEQKSTLCMSGDVGGVTENGRRHKYVKAFPRTSLDCASPMTNCVHAWPAYVTVWYVALNQISH